MPMTRTMTSLERSRAIGFYGPRWRQGILSEHLHLVDLLDGVRIVRGGIATFVVDDQAGGRAYPVLCSELVEIRTEDGPVVGRCGRTMTDDGACEGRAAEIRGWREMSEPERARWERERER